jgi:hypothetical protein
MLDLESARDVGSELNALADLARLGRGGRGVKINTAGMEGERMKPSREKILADVIELVPTVRDDAAHWGDQNQIAEETRLLGDLGWGSIEVVILATATQERYGGVFPFIEWWEEIGRQGGKDIAVREWVNFVHAQLNERSSPTGTGPETP